MHASNTKASGYDPAFTRLVVLISIFIKSNILIFELYSYHPVLILNNLFSIVPILFLISFSYLFTRKGQLYYLLGVDIFISVLFIADIIYVRAYGHLITFHMVLARNVLNGLWDIIFSLTRWSDFLFLSDIPLLLLISSKTEWKNASRRILLFFTSFVLSAAVLCLRFIQLQESKAISDFKMHTLWMSPIGNHMYDIYSFIYESTDPLSEKETTEVDTWLENNRKFSGPSADFAALEGMSRGKNLIIIQFESLESFLIGRSFYGQEITPNINKLLGSSIYFRNIVEQVMDGNSSDAEFMFNTSLYPIRRGSTFISFGDKEYPSLQKLLKDMEYTTIAIHGDDREYWNRDEAFPALGFDRYIDETDFIDKTAIGMGISDCSLFKQTALEIEDLREPFSIFVITLTSHGPFNIGENKYLDLPLKDVSSDYLQSIHYTDKMFGEFYEWLSAKGYLENTMFVIYGDHEGIHKYYHDQTWLPVNDSKVPFIIHIPGMEGFVSDKAGGQVDMMPTLAYLLGIDRAKYAPFIMGRNLFGKYSGSALLPNGIVLDGADGEEQLAEALRIADMSIRGDYYGSNMQY